MSVEVQNCRVRLEFLERFPLQNRCLLQLVHNPDKAWIVLVCYVPLYRFANGRKCERQLPDHKQRFVCHLLSEAAEHDRNPIGIGDQSR